jgi:hypothetical protein
LRLLFKVSSEIRNDAATGLVFGGGVSHRCAYALQAQQTIAVRAPDVISSEEVEIEEEEKEKKRCAPV